jgi:hypothetical protein
MDRGLQPERRAGDDDARDEHGPAAADAGTRFLNGAPAAGVRCVVHVLVGTIAIRALFGREQPPVPEDEWDEAGYVAQRLRAYSEALEALALVRAMPSDEENASTRAARETAHGASTPVTLSCPRTGDRVRIHLDDVDEARREGLRVAVERALGRVFGDANGWRRNLLPAYFERHRSWRAVAGGPIQH